MDISECPQEVEAKERVGDREADTVMGKAHGGAVVSLVDRASKQPPVRRVDRRRAETVGRAMVDMPGSSGAPVRTVTADSGKGFAGHAAVAEALEAAFFFARPHHSRERGLNEHTNGPPRGYPPKGTDLRTVTDGRVREVRDILNARPRRSLDYLTPAETPATGAFPEEDIDLLHTMLEPRGHRDAVGPPDGRAPDIRTSVIDPGRPVGPHPNPRRPPPGTKKVWQGPGRLNRAIQVRDALGKRRREWDDVQVWDFVRARAGVPAGRRRPGCSPYVTATHRPVEAPDGAPALTKFHTCTKDSVGVSGGHAVWTRTFRFADARAANIGRVVRDHRFPILPGVRVHGPAPHVPPMAADRVADDRRARYSVRSVAACTHVGKGYSGRGQRGAVRAPAGSTSGRRGVAGTVTVPAPGTAGGRRSTTWTAVRWERPPDSTTTPVILPTGAGRKSACRPLPDPWVTMRHIPGPHHGATADRRRAGPVIPAERDTTTINHSHLRATEGLPEIGGGGSGSVGVPARAGPVTTTYLTGSFPSPLGPGPYGPGMGFRDVGDAQALPWLPGSGQELALRRAEPGEAGDGREVARHGHVRLRRRPLADDAPVRGVDDHRPDAFRAYVPLRRAVGALPRRKLEVRTRNAVIASKARHPRRSPAASGLRSLIPVPVLRALKHSPMRQRSP